MNNKLPLDTLSCPKCGAVIPVSETLYRQLSESATQEAREEADKRLKAIAEKERELGDREKAVDEAVQARLLSEKSKLLEQLQSEAKLAVSIEMEDLRRAATEKDSKLKEHEKRELELLREKRELQEREQNIELETARRMDAERKKVQDETASRVEEEHRRTDAEKDKRLQDVLKANEEMRRKLQQGSQQAQGEVLELELEDLLKSKFVQDSIEPVPKGVNGADVIQRVVSPAGHACGIIVWESKSTKAWSDGWIQKLKDDQRVVKGDIAILVSEALPKDMKNFGQVNGIWVASPSCALGLAMALRSSLISVSNTKMAAVGKNEKMEFLFQYLSGSEFKQRIEAIVEAFVEMQSDLNDERRVAERRWAKREKQIQKVIGNTSGMYGDFQGLIGSSMQSIPALAAGIDAGEKGELSADNEDEMVASDSHPF